MIKDPKSLWFCTFLICSSTLAACDGTSDDAAAHPEGAEQSTVAITLSSGATETVAQITPAQVKWLASARGRARERLLAGLPPVQETPPAATAIRSSSPVASALTEGSTDWANCQNLDWLLVTEFPDWGGRIFCARFSTTAGFTDGIIISHGQFVPKFFDSASGAPGIVFNLCHASSGPCVLTQCCVGDGTCPQIHRSFFQNSGSGNISPPPSVRVINAHQGISPC